MRSPFIILIGLSFILACANTFATEQPVIGETTPDVVTNSNGTAPNPKQIVPIPKPNQVPAENSVPTENAIPKSNNIPTQNSIPQPNRIPTPNAIPPTTTVVSPN